MNDRADERLTDSLGRRHFLKVAGLASFPMLGGSLTLSGADSPASREAVKLIPRQRDPKNLEFPFASLNGFLTPNELFYVRNHYTMPKIDPKTWRLKVEGAVERPLELSYEQIRELPTKTLTVTLECAGNGRSFLTPKAKGVLWELGAVSTAEWTGVPLAVILDKAGVKSNAVDVVLEGADTGNPANDAKPPGVLTFSRGMPLAKARKPEVILAHRMNGVDLPAEHGHPLRAIVGGWYGMASVKWLTRIVVEDRPFAGYEQTMSYAVWERREGLSSLTPITEIDVKASIARPTPGELVAANAAYRVHGAAWAGEAEVTKVEVSIDGGRTWETARLLGKPVPLAWRLWEYNWRPTSAGTYTLLARATDSRGRVQTMKRDPGRRNYMITHVRPTAVKVTE